VALKLIYLMVTRIFTLARLTTCNSMARPGQVWIPDELYPFPAAE
jgi:hypothetical protein